MIKKISFSKGKYIVTTDIEKVDIDAVYSFLNGSNDVIYQSKEAIIKSINNSLCFSIFEAGKQIGIVRVITDYESFAYICDMFVEELHRDKGLGTWMLECMLNHPDLRDVKKWLTKANSSQEVFRRFGFACVPIEDTFMELLSE